MRPAANPSCSCDIPLHQPPLTSSLQQWHYNSSEPLLLWDPRAATNHSFLRPFFYCPVRIGIKVRHPCEVVRPCMYCVSIIVLDLYLKKRNIYHICFLSLNNFFFSIFFYDIFLNISISLSKLSQIIFIIHVFSSIIFPPPLLQIESESEQA